jgi:hypothetical protein
MRDFMRAHGIHVLAFTALLASSSAGCIIQEGSTGTGGGDTAAGTGSAGTGSSSATTGGGFVAPDAVQVEILGATIALSPNGQDCWDGVCSLQPEDFNKVAEKLAETGEPQEIAAAVAAVLAGYANEAYAPPDPLGTAEIWNDGQYDLAISLASQANNDEDTFTPSWPGDPATGSVLGWKGKFTKDWRIRIRLTDEDLVDDDSIGVVEIGYDDILAALEYGKVYPVRVDEQGNHSILFVSVSAHAI